MTRQRRWQLATLAAAASLICVAQAQIAPALEETPPAQAGTELMVPAAEPAEATQTPAPAEPATTAQSTEGSTDTATPAAPATPAAMPATPPRVIVSPSPAATAAAATTPAPAAAPEPMAAPVTRAQVVAEAIYANEHGLIPRGELAMLHEDKGTLWAEQLAQANRMPQQLAMR